MSWDRPGSPQHVAERRWPPHDHAVYFYERDEDLLRVVGRYLAEGLRGGEAVVAVASATHLAELASALERDGVDVAGGLDTGRVAMLHADEALARFMENEVSDPARFRETFDVSLQRAGRASPRGRVRAYGEMVDALWRSGKRGALLAVEELWNELVEERSFSLLCAYGLEGFAALEHAGVFRDVCARHGTVVLGEGGRPLDAEGKLRLAELEQRARSLEGDVERGRRVEAERVRLYEAERRARAEIALLYRLTDAVNRAETLEQVYDAALDGIAFALGADRASILLFDPDGVMRFKAWRGLSDAYRAAVEGHSPWRPGDRNPAPVLSEDVRADASLSALLPVLERERIGALGFFPLSSGGRLLGKFMVYYPGPHAFTGEEIGLATAIADQVAFAADRTLALLERERFLGIVGHDLKNPLGAISLTAEALVQRVVEPGVATGLRRILSSAHRMERLIGQLLEFAQARSGSGIPVVRRPSDLARIAQAVVDEIEAAHPGRHVAVSIDGDVTGEWDADRLAEVLSNLVGNAVQHGDGSVDVRLRGEADEVVATIHNGGRPIPAALLPSLFDPFRRGGNSGATRSQGVGLGLFISREIARAHGGRIEVRSSEAEGTTLSVRLPRAVERGR